MQAAAVSFMVKVRRGFFGRITEKHREASACFRDDIMMTQAEANALCALEKHAENQNIYEYPAFGGRINIPLVSTDKKENFILDVWRSRIDLSQVTHQNRTRQTIILLRLDLNGPPHTNPDGAVMTCPHLHVYREGYADKWAFPVTQEVFRNIDDAWQTLEDFMDYCNIVEPPNIVRDLFT